MSALTTIDASLLSFLNSADEREEEQQLLQLISEHADPTVRRVIWYKLKSYTPSSAPWFGNPDVEEIYHDIQLHLLKRFRDIKRDPSLLPITNLRSYITSIAHHICDDYLRRKYPFRHHLKGKVRYHLISHQEFRLSETREREWLAGLAAWGEECFEGLKEFKAKSDSLLERLSDQLQGIDGSRLQLRTLLKKVFTVSGHPLELDFLTGLIARLQGVKDSPAIALGVGDNHVAQGLISPQEKIDVVLQYRQVLHYLWNEICELPRRQRIALLFNLKSPNGINMITLLPATGIATFERIAVALEIPVEQFEELWSQLPMNDLSIAAYIGATRQQVINLRKNARERLSRRLEALGNMPL